MSYLAQLLRQRCADKTAAGNVYRSRKQALRRHLHAEKVLRKLGGCEQSADPSVPLPLLRAVAPWQEAQVSDHAAPSHSRVGILTSTPHDGGPAVVRDLVCCVHCAYTWAWMPGSGRRRGFCMRCNGITCGRQWCDARGCCHRKQDLDNMEQGRPEGYRPIIVSVPALPEG